MRIFKQLWPVFFLVLSFVLIPLTIVNATALTDKVTNVPVDKVWMITFNHPVIESSITPNSIYIVNSDNVKQTVKMVVEDDIVKIEPPAKGYEFNQTYTLKIEADVSGKIGNRAEKLNQTIAKTFTTVNGYAVVNIKIDGSSSPIAYYSTFEEANANLQESQGIMLGNKYIKIPSGVIATNLKDVTIIYKQPTFTTALYEYAGVSTDTELLYVDATAEYVKVNAAGQDMYVKHGDVTLIPAAAAKGQSYYIANEKGLWHHIYHHHRGKYDSAYLVGNKPAFLNDGVKYYSTDGVKFYNANGTFVGESYAYFQYVTPRVPTTYSAEQLDQYIARELEAKELSGNVRYINASAKSPLQGLGTTLKTIEKEQRINALFILSLAIHESDYGMSCHAQNYNNLFGLNVTDSNDECLTETDVNTESNKYFPSIEKNISDFVKRLNTSYLDPLNMQDYRYNGLALGNKMIGLNVRYASDPYWGAKTAGHMYRIDQALGSQDYKEYKVGITASSQVSVRYEPIVKIGDEENRAYQYKLPWTIKRLDMMPITLANMPLENSDWLQVISELPSYGKDLYTVGENVHIITTH